MDQEIEQPVAPAPSSSKKSNNLPMTAAMAVIVIIGVGGFFYLNNKNNKMSVQKASVDAAQTTMQPTQAMKEATASPTQSSVSQNVKAFTVTGSNFKFDPSTITVNKGDTVKITFKNADGFHDLQFPDFNTKTEKIPAGQEQTISFVADKTGTFEYFCSVGQHRAMGMKGTLTVQ